MEFSRRQISVFLFVFLFGGAIFLIAVDAEVVTLTSETFSDKVKEKGTVWFVKFCVPWCKYCKNLGSLWEDLAKIIEDEDEIEIGQVDCGAEKSVCTKVDIHSYPTFKVFYAGEEVSRYRGPKQVESMKEFLLDAARNATQAEAESDSEL